VTDVSAEIEARARELWDCCPTVKPAWDQLGEVTKNVWREMALAGYTPTKPSTVAHERDTVEVPVPAQCRADKQSGGTVMTEAPSDGAVKKRQEGSEEAGLDPQGSLF